MKTPAMFHDSLPVGGFGLNPEFKILYLHLF